MTYLRIVSIIWLLIIVPAQGSAEALVDVTVKSFVKRCNVYVNAESRDNASVRLTRERAKLRKHKVPISLHLADCENAHYKIGLRNGGVTLITFGYPTNEDPDYKGDQYEWTADSPSSDFWRFDFYGWEWGGWVLVDKRTGRKIETKTECGGGAVNLIKNYIATMCSGAYENKVDTLYIADMGSEPVNWSKGIQQGLCPNDERFSLYEFQSQKPGMFAIEYQCESGAVVKAVFSVDNSGLKSLIRGVNRHWEWDR